MRNIIETWPDLHVSLEDVFAEGDKVARRCVIIGTNVATGEPLNSLMLGIIYYSGGKMVRGWELAVPVTTIEKA